MTLIDVTVSCNLAGLSQILKGERDNSRQLREDDFAKGIERLHPILMLLRAS
jgi:hypothetical protein